MHEGVGGQAGGNALSAWKDSGHHDTPMGMQGGGRIIMANLDAHLWVGTPMIPTATEG